MSEQGEVPHVEAHAGLASAAGAIPQPGADVPGEEPDLGADGDEQGGD